jgi:rhamnopyranosyl-N-acetylglucosaminyl-diphospho-decaprenol beta-1,3/1,4-galactofuranosyltransferase
MNNKVIAIVVTFNKKKLLLNAIHGILDQSNLPDEILVIDNNSSDGTFELLSKENFIGDIKNNIPNKFQVFSKKILSNTNKVNFNYFKNNKNEGGAGGFNLGVEIATYLGGNLFWLMDDDGVPSKDCLKQLIISKTKNNLDMIGPLVLDIAGSDKLSFGINGHTSIDDDFDDIIFNKTNLFNGNLFDIAVFNSIGNIKKEMFIWGDEVEFMNRMILNKINFATCTKAKFYHPLNKTSYDSLFFGLIKNVPIKPENLQMVFYRNQGYIKSKYFSRYRTLIFAIKMIVYFLFKGNIKSTKNFVLYYLDGVNDNFSRPIFLITK